MKQPCASKLNDGTGMRKITEGQFLRSPEWTVATTTRVSRIRDTASCSISHSVNDKYSKVRANVWRRDRHSHFLREHMTPIST